MPYFDHDDLAALIPGDFLTQALDDDNDGEEDAFEAVQSHACDAVDAYLAARYTVPLTTDPLPALVKRAATTFAAELCYQRRGTPKEQNPWTAHADSLRSLLTDVARGKVPLQISPAAPEPAAPSGSIITYDSPLGEPTRRLG